MTVKEFTEHCYDTKDCEECKRHRLYKACDEFIKIWGACPGYYLGYSFNKEWMESDARKQKEYYERFKFKGELEWQ